MLVAAARRMEPSQPPRRRRRWPGVMAGIVMLTAGSAAAALFRSRRGRALVTGPTAADQPRPAPGGPASARDLADLAQSDVNGQLRTP